MALEFDASFNIGTLMQSGFMVVMMYYIKTIRDLVISDKLQDLRIKRLEDEHEKKAAK